VPDRLVHAGMLNYPVRPASTVRFFATARGTKDDGSLPTATELWKALAGAGFGPNLMLFAQGTARPGDWPFESAAAVPPMPPEETVAFRGEGSWPSGQLPTALRMASGPSIQFWMVWEHSDAPQQVATGLSAMGADVRMGLLTGFLMGLGMGISKGSRRR
jgi:hypothetical protein